MKEKKSNPTQKFTLRLLSILRGETKKDKIKRIFLIIASFIIPIMLILLPFWWKDSDGACWIKLNILNDKPENCIYLETPPMTPEEERESIKAIEKTIKSLLIDSK